jgi:methyl-accepting chemotaxis protein
MFGKLNGGAGADAVLAAINKSLAKIEFDPAGKIISANENFLSAMGYTAAEIVGQHHRMFVEPAYAQSAEYTAFWGKLGRGEFDAAEYKRLGKGGREIWIQATYNPVLNGSGKVVKVVKFATDITSAKMKAADDAGKLAAISRAQAVIEFTVEGEILTANENFCGALGYDLGEIKGRHHRMFVEPAYGQSGEYADFWRRLRGGEFLADEFKRIGKGGREIWIQASYNPIFDPDGRVMKVVKFATDITGRVHAVTEIGEGLGKVAGGDLTCEITEPFIPALDKLRLDFNNSVETLRSALQKVGHNAASIDAAGGEVSSAATDLSKRTEQQAASVEETAAALDEITATVKASAQRAEEAGGLVARTRASAEKSETVVRQAIETMGGIDKSSREIGSIIGVIDEIAFQTNLLALNAGVEAARAGEAGKGFAVVAQEVRALAQRSAEAAKQIKELITKSGEEVRSGVSLVGETGAALETILKDVREISEHVVAIVEASREQSTALAEINTAVGTIDQGTQQNAAMVEETSAASQSLASEAQQLNALLRTFRLGAPAMHQPHPVARTAGRAPASRPAAVQLRTQGSAALAHSPEQAGWEEF